jgi:hypothetical protein
VPVVPVVSAGAVPVGAVLVEGVVGGVAVVTVWVGGGRSTSAELPSPPPRATHPNTNPITRQETPSTIGRSQPSRSRSDGGLLLGRVDTGALARRRSRRGGRRRRALYPPPRTPRRGGRRAAGRTGAGARVHPNGWAPPLQSACSQIVTGGANVPPAARAKRGIGEASPRRQPRPPPGPTSGRPRSTPLPRRGDPAHDPPEGHREVRDELSV